MQTFVIEYELTCADHGAHRLVAPVSSPAPSKCAHCFLPLAALRELRRYGTEDTVPVPFAPEVWLG